jgi:hypothetical protein
MLAGRWQDDWEHGQGLRTYVDNSEYESTWKVKNMGLEYASGRAGRFMSENGSMGTDR